MLKGLVVRGALITDALGVDDLLSEWFDWKPSSGRSKSVRRAVKNRELLVAEADSRIIGFIHYVMHEDIIDGGLNSFISAFFVTQTSKRTGVGTLLLEEAIRNSLARGAVGVETSTMHALAKQLSEKHQFKQTLGDIGAVFLELDLDASTHSKEQRGGDTES